MIGEARREGEETLLDGVELARGDDADRMVRRGSARQSVSRIATLVGVYVLENKG